MTDILDKAILIGIGLEKRAKDILNELASEGKEAKGAQEPGFPPKQELENKLVEEGTKAVRELIATAKAGKEKVNKEIHEVVERLLEKFKVVTKDDIEIIEKMAQKAREKVDALEKRVEEMEKRSR
ncbi:MAG: accessory factor UbiK family protein [Deltaproteobacteria bacterium]|nr:accessory factor UbiK family protein [Deltaproteobacteria bacterium]